MAVGDTALPYPRLPNTAKNTPTPNPGPTPTGVTLTAQQLSDETAADVDRATRVLPVVVEMVTRYAPHAPTAVANEAALRFGGYLLGSDFGVIRREELGPMNVEYVTNHAAMFRNSGAASLLTRYKRRRAGTI